MQELTKRNIASKKSTNIQKKIFSCHSFEFVG